MVNNENIMDTLRSIIPEVKFDTSAKVQLEKVIEECNEAIFEFEAEDNIKLLYEMVDVVTASVNALYKSRISDVYLQHGFDYVVEKNRRRGYYDESQLELPLYSEHKGL